jgi:hypothetical protein
MDLAKWQRQRRWKAKRTARIVLPFVSRRRFDALACDLAGCQAGRVRMQDEIGRMEKAMSLLAGDLARVRFDLPIGPEHLTLAVHVEFAPEVLMGSLDEREMIAMAVVAKVRQEIMTTRLLPFPVRP